MFSVIVFIYYAFYFECSPVIQLKMLNNLKENSQIRDQSRSMANCSPKVCFIIHIFRNKMSHQLLKNRESMHVSFGLVTEAAWPAVHRSSKCYWTRRWLWFCLFSVYTQLFNQGTLAHRMACRQHGKGRIMPLPNEAEQANSIWAYLSQLYGPISPM